MSRIADRTRVGHARRRGVRRVSATTLAGLVLLLVSVSGRAEGWTPVSYLPLAGSPYDAVTGGQLAFSRETIAFDRAGREVPPGRMRTGRFAVETGRNFEFVEMDVPELRPLLTDGIRLYAATESELFSSGDGTEWTSEFEMPSYIRSGFATTQGTILLAVGGDGYAQLYRWLPGESVITPVLAFEEGCPAPRNYCETDTHLFVSEYGSSHNKHQPNPRRIYRSGDDGLTWTLVYDPEYRDTHNHNLSWDPYEQRVFQATGDGYGNTLCIRTLDHGETWQVEHNELYMPTAAIPRPDAVYWGLDGLDPAGVARRPRGAENWELMLYLGCDDPPRDDQFDGNTLTMAEYGGILIAPVADTKAKGKNRPGAAYTSVDGEHWTLTARFGLDLGFRCLLGEMNGRLWADYVEGDDVTENHRLMAIDPPVAHRLIRGTRLEGLLVNLWDSEEASSIEGTLAGWSPYHDAVLEVDHEVVWHGAQSLRVISDEAVNGGVDSPTCFSSLPAGTIVSALAHVSGAPQRIVLDLLSSTGESIASTTAPCLSHRWRAVYCAGQVPSDAAGAYIRIRQKDKLPGFDLRVDGILMAITPGGDTWQVGGAPRWPDRAVYDFAFPPEWTDLFLWAPDPGADGDIPAIRTLKTYETAGGRQLRVIYDPGQNVLRLVDSGDLTASIATAPFYLAPECVLQVGVTQSATERSLYLRIAEDPCVASVATAPLAVVRTFIGSDSGGQSTAGGLLARCQLFDQPADTTQIGELFTSLISAPLPGDFDDDTDVDLDDFASFQACLAGPGAAVGPGCQSGDMDLDNDLDLRDFHRFGLAFTGSL